MAERMRHAFRALRIATVVTALLWMCISLFGGCGYYRYAAISDYEDFLANFAKSESSGDPTIPDSTILDASLPSIEGFEPLVTACFDYGQGFTGDFAFAGKDDKTYIIDKNGMLRATDFPFFESELRCGKVIVKANGMYGVCDLFGNAVLPIMYQRVEIIGNTVLAIDGHTATVVSTRGTAEKTFAKDVYLADETHIFCDGTYYDVQFAEKRAGNCLYLDVPQEDRVLVSDPDNGLIGYADASGNIVVEPQFIGGESFSEGTAVVREVDRTSSVIDKEGNRLYHSKEDKFCQLYDGMRCFVRYNAYGVMDAAFNVIVPPYLMYVKNERVYGDYLIVKRETKETLFSVRKNAYEAFAYDQIEAIGDLFLCRTDDLYCIMDRSLRVLAENCDSVSYDGEVLTVRRNATVMYYKKKG